MTRRLAVFGLLLLAGCRGGETGPGTTGRTNRAGDPETGLVTSSDGSVSLRAPAGWEPRADPEAGVLLWIEPPPDDELAGVRLTLTQTVVPGLDEVAVSRWLEDVLERDLPKGWSGAGFVLVSRVKRKCGPRDAIVIESRLGDGAEAIWQRQYCYHHGTVQHVLTGSAVRSKYNAAKELFEATAESLRFGKGGEG